MQAILMNPETKKYGTFHNPKDVPSAENLSDEQRIRACSDLCGRKKCDHCTLVNAHTGK